MSRTEREVKIRFTGESAVLKGSAGEVRKVFQMLTSDLNDSRGAGEKLAAAYEQVADSMRKDMAAIAETADVVRDSLGPEMTQAIEASGRTVEDQVQEWRKLGLTLDDITRDSDQLAAGLRQLDDSARQSTGSVGDGMKRIGTETENSRSVMANFTGNAIQELPGVAGAMGPLNMAIGQFAEYATEGNIKLKNLLATGAGIGIAAGAMQAFADRAAKLAEVKAIDAAAVDGYTEALAEAGSRMEAIANHLREIEKIQITLGADGGFWTGGVTGAIDLTEAFVALGLTVDDTARLIEGGTEQIDAWGAAMIAAGAEAGVVEGVMYGMKQQVEAVTTAAENNAVTQAFLGDELGNTADELDRGTDSLVGHMDATARDTLAQEALTEATERAEEAQRDLTAAQLASIDTVYAVADAQDRFTESMETLAVAVDDPTTGVNELDQAQRSAEQSALALAQANVANAEAMAIAAGAPLSAAQSNYLLIESLYATALTLDENSPVRAALLGHIGTLQGVPTNVATTVTADTEQAQEDIGKVLTDAEKLNTETDTKANADTATALDLVQTLTLAIEGIPKTIGIDVNLSGVTAVLSSVADLRRSLQSLADLSDEVLLSIDAGIRRVKQGTR